MDQDVEQETGKIIDETIDRMADTVMEVVKKAGDEYEKN